MDNILQCMQGICDAYNECRFLTITLLSEPNGISKCVYDSIRRIETFPDIESLVLQDSKTHRYYLTSKDIINLLKTPERTVDNWPD